MRLASAGYHRTIATNCSRSGFAQRRTIPHCLQRPSHAAPLTEMNSSNLPGSESSVYLPLLLLVRTAPAKNGPTAPLCLAVQAPRCVHDRWMPYSLEHPCIRHFIPVGKALREVEAAPGRFPAHHSHLLLEAYMRAGKSSGKTAILYLELSRAYFHTVKQMAS